MGFCLLFGWKRREGVISSQSKAHASLVSSFHRALRCTFRRQKFGVMTEDVAVLVGEQHVEAVGVASLRISTKVKVE